MQTRTKFLIAIVTAAIAALALSACSSSPSGASASSGSSGQTNSSASASSASSEQSASSTASASSSQSSSDVDDVLDASDVVFISLDYNAGTGYEWVCRADPEGILVQTDKTTESESNGNEAGGPLRDRFTFKAQSPGEVVLTFDLVRSWEEGAEPAETQVYAFTVTKFREIQLDREKSNYKIDPEWISYS